MDPDIHEREERLLRANMMGDIREDVEFLGLNLRDIIWIIGNTLVIGALFSYVLPFEVWGKIIWILIVFMFNLISRFRKWPYRRKRYIRDFRTKREGSGEDFKSLLNIEEDSWLYRSGKVIHIVSEISAPPWQTAVYAQKRKRIASFENFLRGIVREGFKATITSEKVPDFRLDLWKRKRNAPAASDGIHKLRLRRVALWEHLATNGEALKSEYHLTLSIDEHRVTLREQDGEPEDMKPADIKKLRFMAGIREKYGRIIVNLHSSGHDTTLMSGYSVPELMARWWDRRSWEDWKMNDGQWDDPTLDESELANTNKIVEEDYNPDKMKEEIPDESGLEFTLDKEISEGETVEQDGMEDDAIQTALQAVTSEKVSKDSLKRKQANKGKILGLYTKLKGHCKFLGLWLMKVIQKALCMFSDKVRSLNKKSKLSRKPRDVEPKGEEINACEELDGTEIAEVPPNVSASLNSLEFANKALLITAPASTGKTFLAANVSAAVGESGVPVTLIDLTKDRGTLTVLNPVKQPYDRQGWEKWESRHASNLQIICPTHYPSIQEVRQIIEVYRADGAVLVDLPWAYPSRDELIGDYETIGVVDCDYHHWLQWENSVERWNGRLWLNQCDSDMKKRMSQLIRDKYSLTFEREFPHFSTANKYLFQGRPLALEAHARSSFCFTEMEESQCSPMPSE
ncbi:hypothetical protein AAXB25_33475 [Paenibacillus lautus]|uniref:hypothetical protein n=1 Tax=Paenibacillus lautus TaxID=1401 RepID=UPI003D2C9D82